MLCSPLRVRAHWANTCKKLEELKYLCVLAHLVYAPTPENCDEKQTSPVTDRVNDRFSKPNFYLWFSLLCWSVNNNDRHKQITIVPARIHVFLIRWHLNLISKR